LGAGEIVRDNGGRDFFGSPVPAASPPSIGASEASRLVGRQ
jgi:hypothetical protein